MCGIKFRVIQDCQVWVIKFKGDCRNFFRGMRSTEYHSSVGLCYDPCQFDMVDSTKYHKIHELQLSFAKMEKACQRFKPEEENT